MTTKNYQQNSNKDFSPVQLWFCGVIFMMPFLNKNNKYSVKGGGNMHSSHTPEGSPPFSPSPEPIKTSRQHALIQSLYGEVVAACKNSLTLDVPEKPDEFMSLPTDTRKLYIAIRMHCETCIAESGRYIGANWADFRLVAISLKLIEWLDLDIEVLIGDVPKLTELMLTLLARLEGWVNTLVPGVDRSFFIKASMTR